MFLSDLAIDVKAQVGEILWLSKVRTYKAQGKGEKDGFRYDIFCVGKDMLKLSVKIPGAQQMNAPESGYTPVELSNLTLRPYVANVSEKVEDGEKRYFVDIAFVAMATEIKAVPQK